LPDAITQTPRQFGVVCAKRRDREMLDRHSARPA
jgi:hypothetical protein